MNFKEIAKVDSWKKYDEQITSKVFGKYFKSTSDYYWHASSLHCVQGIKVPTMVIHSKDDPIIPIECLPVDECLANENIIVGIVRKGAHICYFTGVSGKVRWYPLVTGEYCDVIIEMNEEKKK